METITIPKQEYEKLMEYKQIVDLEFERPLSKELLKKLEDAELEIRAGKGRSLHSKHGVKEYLNQL